MRVLERGVARHVDVDVDVVVISWELISRYLRYRYALGSPKRVSGAQDTIWGM